MARPEAGGGRTAPGIRLLLHPCTSGGAHGCRRPDPTPPRRRRRRLHRPDARLSRACLQAGTGDGRRLPLLDGPAPRRRVQGDATRRTARAERSSMWVPATGRCWPIFVGTAGWSAGWRWTSWRPRWPAAATSPWTWVSSVTRTMPTTASMPWRRAMSSNTSSARGSFSPRSVGYSSPAVSSWWSPPMPEAGCTAGTGATGRGSSPRGTCRSSPGRASPPWSRTPGSSTSVPNTAGVPMGSPAPPGSSVETAVGTSPAEPRSASGSPWRPSSSGKGPGCAGIRTPERRSPWSPRGPRRARTGGIHRPTLRIVPRRLN